MNSGLLWKTMLALKSKLISTGVSILSLN